MLKSVGIIELTAINGKRWQSDAFWVKLTSFDHNHSGGHVWFWNQTMVYLQSVIVNFLCNLTDLLYA
jgi:hypothetical protein